MPIAALWGDGAKGSADMMAIDASRHLWTARVDPRRRTYAAVLYTHMRDRWRIFYDQPIVLNERQAGVAVEGVVQHNRAEDRIRVSLLAVDTHGVTNVAMAIAKLLGFDLCPRLRDLRERKLFVPRAWPVPERLEAVTVRRVSPRPSPARAGHARSPARAIHGRQAAQRKRPARRTASTRAADIIFFLRRFGVRGNDSPAVGRTSRGEDLILGPGRDRTEVLQRCVLQLLERADLQLHGRGLGRELALDLGERVDAAALLLRRHLHS